MIKLTTQLAPGDWHDGQEITRIETDGDKSFITYRGGSGEHVPNDAQWLIDKPASEPSVLVLQSQTQLLSD